MTQKEYLTCCKRHLLRFIVRLLAEAVELLSVPGVFALLADKLSHALALLLGNADAFAVEPVVAKVAANVELGVVVGRATRAEELLFTTAAAGAARGHRAFLPLLGRRLGRRARR